jgi:hypothetical protein
LADYIRLERPYVRGTRLSVELDCSPRVRKYLRQRVIWVEYDPLSVDLEAVPEGILVIPAVGNLVTLAWALGVELVVPALDERYVEALTAIKSTFQDFYPFFQSHRSAVVVGSRDAHAAVPSERVGLLFSGGIDSTTSLVEHDAVVTDLFSVWGADVPTRNVSLWNEHLRPTIMDDSIAQKKVQHFLRSNLRECLDEFRLDRDFGDLLTSRNWWGAVQHGLGLVSLTAPVAFQRGVRRLLIAATHSGDYAPPWGSSPRIDNHIAWSGTVVEHDGFHRTRQDKIQEVLAPFILGGHEMKLTVCFMPRSGKSPNCSSCEKCFRTIAGLLLAGVDPNRCGFSMDESTLRRTARGFRLRRFRSIPIRRWAEIQRRIPEDLDELVDLHGSRRFFGWLKEFDLEGYAARAAVQKDSRLKTKLLFASRVMYRGLPVGMQARLHRAMRQR